MSEQSEGDAEREVKFCAPVDFGVWHLTVDEEMTLCEAYEVGSHHISGTFDVFKPQSDCTECYRIYRTVYADTEREDADE